MLVNTCNNKMVLKIVSKLIVSSKIITTFLDHRCQTSVHAFATSAQDQYQ
jgi:hypothetical protein